MRHNPMFMKDYIDHLDRILSSTGEKLLTDAGSVFHAEAMKKAELEYRKFQEKNLSPVETAYLETIKTVAKEVKKK